MFDTNHCNVLENMFANLPLLKFAQ